MEHLLQHLEASLRACPRTHAMFSVCQPETGIELFDDRDQDWHINGDGRVWPRT